MAVIHALTDLSRHYRKALIGVLFMGGLGLIVSALLGHPLAGVLLWAGLALGFINSRLALSSVSRFTAGEDHSKRRFAVSAARRLVAITVVAVALALTFRPDGLAVIIGLGVFQMLMLGTASGEMLREVRKG